MSDANVLPLAYTQGGEDMLDRVEPLWNKLNRHHRALATQNKEHYDRITFELRKAMIIKQAAPGKIMVLLACNPAGEVKAYCASLVDTARRGEIASIYVDDDLRSQGIGSEMMNRSLEWMRYEGAEDTMVTVLPENGKALEFYARFGFYKRLILMLKPEL